MQQKSLPCRVLLFEVNEISWELMQPWLGRGELPNFERLRQRGTTARTQTDERPPLLEPWITWTTVYTGVPQREHGMEFLEQPPETIRAKRLWDLADEAGKKVGVFGSVSSWPPRPVNGFFVPGSFSPDSQTYPEELRPIQDLNLGHTRAHAPGAAAPGWRSMLASAWRLRKHGLNARAACAILKTLVEIKLHTERNWKKVCLQPVVNLAFFRHLYRRYRPDLATFHTNHVAHYQHRFLRAWRPDLFPDATDAEEVRRFGDAIHYGYTVADRLLGELMDLTDREGDVVLCVLSSMGQKAFVPERYGKVAPETCRVRSIERLLALLGVAGNCEYFSAMAPQWNLRIRDGALRRRVKADLEAARYEPLGKSMYSALEVQDALVLTPVSHHGLGAQTVCRFPTLPGAPEFPFDELVIQADDTRKSGCHDPVGMLAFYGRGVRATQDLGELNTLDVAPTVLSLLGAPVPAHMKGQDFSDAVTGRRPAPAAGLVG
jgi:hypothetical protein